MHKGLGFSHKLSRNAAKAKKSVLYLVIRHLKMSAIETYIVRRHPSVKAGFYPVACIQKAQLGFQSLSRFFFGTAVSFATPFMAWIIDFARIVTWTLVHIWVKTL